MPSSRSLSPARSAAGSQAVADGRPPGRRPLRILLAVVRGALVTIGALCALILLGLWFAAAHLNDYRADIERAVGEMLGHRIVIGTVEASWEGLSPVLKLRDVEIFGRAAPRGDPIVRLVDAEIAIDPVASARSRTLRSRRLRVVGAAVTLTRGTSGQIRLAGFTGQPGTPVQVEDERYWDELLLGQRELELLATDILWLDPASTRPPAMLGQLNAHMRNAGGGHHVQGWVTLAGAKSAPVSFSADLEGTPASPGWRGRVEVKGSDLELASLSRLSAAWHPLVAGTELLGLAGRATGHLTAEVGAEGVSRLDATVTTTRLRVHLRGAPPGRPARDRVLALERLEVQGDIARTARGWDARTHRLRVVSRSGPWPLTSASVQLQDEADAGTKVHLVADAIRLEHLTPLLEPYVSRPSLAHTLAGAAPRGELRGITVDAVLHAHALVRARVQAEVHDLTTHAVRALPGVRGVNGRLVAGLHEGRLELTPGPAEVEIPPLYPSPRELRSAAGVVHWTLGQVGGEVSSDGLELTAPGVRAHLSGAVRWRPGERPTLDGHVTLARTRYVDLAPWIELEKMPPRLRRWLATAVQDGEVEALEMTVDGRLDTLPFRAGPDGFKVEATVRGAVVAYAPGWPLARGVAAKVHLAGPQFAAEVSEGRIFALRTRGLAVRADVGERPLVLNLAGELEGDTGDVLRFVRESPLRERQGRQLGALRASGGCRLEVGLALDVTSHAAARLSGTLDLADNRLDSGLGIALERASGRVRFDGNSIVIPRIDATYLGAAVRLSAETPAGGGTVLRLEGTADRALIAGVARSLGLADASFQARAISGRTAWKASFTLPGAGRSNPSVLALSSPLTGLALDLPGSLGKPHPEETRPLALALVFERPDRRVLQLHYGTQWGGVLALERGTQGWRIERGHVRVGGGPTALPPAPGVVVDGHLETFHFDAWSRVLSGPGALVNRSTAGWAADVRRVALEVEHLHAFDQVLTVSRIVLTRSPKTWEIAISGQDVAGRIRVPHAPAPAGSPLEIRLDHLKVARTGGGRRYGGRLPSAFPPIDADVTSLTVEGRDLGKVRVRTSPMPEGLRVADLEVHAPAFSLSGEGTWRYVDGHHQTTVDAKVHADDLGALLGAFGYAQASIRDGRTDLAAHLAWAGVPSDFDLKVATGSVSGRSSKGQLLDVRPGLTGRAFGLLSFAALPHLLRWDFSYVFGKGFFYDTIEGGFHLEGGNAYTNNLHMIGPTARVDLAGRTGLVERDYDQLVTITPRLTSSLPFAPLWLAEKMLRTNVLNRVFSTRYTLTGSWDKPKVVRVEEPEEETEDSPPS